MKTFIIGLCTLVTFVNAHANSAGPQDLRAKELAENRSYFDGLAEHFAMGTRPDISKILHKTIPGRCYFYEKPHNPIGAVLYIRPKAPAAHGPLALNTAPAYEAVRVITSYATSFDQITPTQLMSRYSLTFSDLRFTDKALTLNQRGEKRFVTTYKQSGEFLIEENQDMAVTDRTNKTNMRCYYFKK